MPEAPTAEQFFGAGEGQPEGGQPPQLPSASQFFGLDKPQAGAAMDTLWSSAQHAGARILNSVGYGAQEAWGSRPLGLSPEVEQVLRKGGVINDYETGHTSFLKSFNEALIRPAASLADLFMRAPSTALSAAGAGAEQAEQEIRGPAEQQPGIVRRTIGGAVGALGELSQGAAEGAIIPDLAAGPVAHGGPIAAASEAAAAERVLEAAKARSAGVVGEGEAGFYEAAQPTPEAMQARTEAAKEAGLDTPPPPPPPAPDVHALARRIDPDTFGQYDALALERDAQREEIRRLSDERDASEPVIAAKQQIDTILGKVNGVEDRLTKAAAQRLADAQGELDRLLSSDTEEMTQARQRLMEADFQMRDLAPQVSEAYRHAQDLMPEPPPAPEAAEEQPARPGATEAEGATKPEAKTETPAAEAAQTGHIVPAVAIEGEGEAPQLAAPQVLGGETLGAAEPGAKVSSGRGSHALKAVEGSGETRARSLSQGVEAKAVEEGLAKTFGDLPEYRTLSMAEQAEAATKLMADDYDLAKAVALGERAPPKGLLPESVFVAVEKRALAEGDVETLRQLGTRSKLSTAATTMGQRIRTLGERDKASPVGAIQEIQAAREAALKAKNVDIEAVKREAVQEIKAEMKQAATVKPDAWADFLGSIRCGD